MELSILNGIAFGSILFLLAVGFSLIMGVMGILNLAHGAIFMIGAYVGWTLAVEHEVNFILAILAGGASAGLVGLAMDRGFLRHLYKQMHEQALLTVGFIFIITNLTLWIFGPIDRPSFVPSFVAGSVPLGGGQYPIFRIATIGIGVVVFLGFWWFQEKTRVGAIVRAGMDNKEMTVALGINLGLVSALVFLLGSFMTGTAGVIGIQLMGADLRTPISILILALIVVVIGGVGSIQGAFVGSMLVGLIDNIGKALFPQFAMFTLFLAMIIVIIVRPRGLLGRIGQWG